MVQKEKDDLIENIKTKINEVTESLDASSVYIKDLYALYREATHNNKKGEESEELAGRMVILRGHSDSYAHSIQLVKNKISFMEGETSEEKKKEFPEELIRRGEMISSQGKQGSYLQNIKSCMEMATNPILAAQDRDRENKNMEGLRASLPKELEKTEELVSALQKLRVAQAGLINNKKQYSPMER